MFSKKSVDKEFTKMFQEKKVRTKKLQKRFIKQKWSGRFLLRNLYKKVKHKIEKNKKLDKKSNPKNVVDKKNKRWKTNVFKKEK